VKRFAGVSGQEHWYAARDEGLASLCAQFARKDGSH